MRALYLFTFGEVGFSVDARKRRAQQQCERPILTAFTPGTLVSLGFARERDREGMRHLVFRKRPIRHGVLAHVSGGVIGRPIG